MIEEGQGASRLQRSTQPLSSLERLYADIQARRLDIHHAENPVVSLASSNPHWFHNTLLASPAMEHIVRDHGYQAPIPLGYEWIRGRGPRASARTDNPSRFYTADPYDIADFGRMAVLSGTPYLSEPGFGRDQQPRIPGRSVLDFSHTLPEGREAIGTHGMVPGQTVPTDRMRFSFELGPHYSHLWNPAQTAAGFHANPETEEPPQIRLMTGHPISPSSNRTRPLLPPPATSIGTPAGAFSSSGSGTSEHPYEVKRGGSIKKKLPRADIIDLLRKHDRTIQRALRR